MKHEFAVFVYNGNHKTQCTAIIHLYTTYVTSPKLTSDTQLLALYLAIDQAGCPNFVLPLMIAPAAATFEVNIWFSQFALLRHQILCPAPVPSA